MIANFQSELEVVEVEEEAAAVVDVGAAGEVGEGALVLVQELDQGLVDIHWEAVVVLAALQYPQPPHLVLESKPTISPAVEAVRSLWAHPLHSPVD
jgi:hypothetical protein